jgi:hypothetical protein
MTKTVKRIIAVVLLLVMVLLIGYSCYTANRLASYPDTLDGYKNMVFRANDGTMVAFTGENVWYAKPNEDMVIVQVESYTEGVLTLKYGEETLQFVAIDEDTLYCPASEQFLRKRGDG